MPQRRDRITLGGRDVYGEQVGASSEDQTSTARRFLSVWFRCCHVYGRMYRNEQQTQYIGRCPKCAAQVQARIGPDGTAQRMFMTKQ